ncbi:ABC transporter ATP-binding protein [Desertibacillus haloalkaliphilus]|uniref:ABC transporter ATP-binding protein n=1 Tax=Desertibacillus haloalkaliphilus TaxID=1328930 RepID=UPI001C261878|nr:ABC transporter ATP-binding protein [Desertibacillus haloalkaliphilus]MBU8907537.1 ABC transporter ATP-binding protein [Desertibacillus haloalkaliphilus]
MAVVTVNNLTKSFDGQTVVDNLSFTLDNDHCIALLGPNGAGKTTTLNMLTGLLRPSAGSIEFEGALSTSNDDLRKYIGYLPQYPVFHDWMSGREFLEYMGKLAFLHAREAERRTKELLQFVGIAEAADRKIGKYSGGMKQRLGIAQAMIHRPKLLILDEPVSALDPIGRREILELIRELKQDTTILFSTHVLTDAEEVSDDVIILHQGEVRVAGSLQHLRKDHQQAVIVVRVDGQAKQWIEPWLQFEFVRNITFESDTAKVFVSDLEQAKSALLRKVIDENIPIEKFEVESTTLEDLFVKVVGHEPVDDTF